MMRSPFLLGVLVLSSCSNGATGGSGGASASSGSPGGASSAAVTTSSASAMTATSSTSMMASSSTGVMQVPCVPSAQWTNVLTGPQVRRIVVSRATGDMYLASYGDGVYRSFDGGATWTNPNVGIGKNLQFHGLGVHDASGTVVACTYDGNNDFGGYEVYRSTDKAATWQKTMSGIGTPGTLCVNVAVDDAHDRIVLGVGWIQTIFVSTDHAMTWVEKDAGWPPNPGTISLGLTLDAQNRLWSGSENFYLWRSSDGGDTWQQFKAGLPPPTNNTHQVQLDSHGNVFVSRTNGMKVGVSKSTDDGASFTDSGLDMESLDALLVAPNDVLYTAGKAASGGLYVSTDGGATWTAMASGLTNPNLLGFAVGLDGTIWAGGDGGLYRSPPVCHL